MFTNIYLIITAILITIFYYRYHTIVVKIILGLARSNPT